MPTCYGAHIDFCKNFAVKAKKNKLERNGSQIATEVDGRMAKKYIIYFFVRIGRTENDILGVDVSDFDLIIFIEETEVFLVEAYSTMVHSVKIQGKV